MRNLMSKLWADDAGVVTIEYLVLGTFLALALIVGVHTLSRAINAELGELGEAILGFNQGYSVCATSLCCATKDGSAVTDVNGSIADLTGTAPAAGTVSVVACP